MDQPWKTDRWFVSPWCYLPEVRKHDQFVPNVKIHDVTLRDGERASEYVSKYFSQQRRHRAVQKSAAP